ncbi:MAG: hypothetical protein WAN05_30980 [Roseiarcus sp.]
MIYICFMIGTIILLIQSRGEKHPQLTVLIGIISALFVTVLVGLFVLVVGILDASRRIVKQARAGGLSVRGYVDSEHYSDQAVELFERTDEEPRWF